MLHRVLQWAIRVGKRIRSATGIDQGRVSVGSVAVDFARQIFERFDNKTVMAIGAGEMAQVVLKHLRGLEPKQLMLANRSLGKARRMASGLGFDGDRLIVQPLSDLEGMLVEADIVLSSVTCTQPIIMADRFKAVVKKRRGRPLFILDIAMPRNVDPAVGDQANVYLYNIDDLQQVVSETYELRDEQAQRSEAMLRQAVASCVSELRNRDVGTLIRDLKRKLNDLARAERQRTERKMKSMGDGSLSADVGLLLEEHTHRLINKILHLPLSQLDSRKTGHAIGLYAQVLRELFRVDESLDTTHQDLPTVQVATHSCGTSSRGQTAAKRVPHVLDGVAE